MAKADARTALRKAVRIARTEIDVIAKKQTALATQAAKADPALGITGIPLDPDDTLSLYRLTRILADVRNAEGEDLKVKKKALDALSTEQLERLVATLEPTQRETQSKESISNHGE